MIPTRQYVLRLLLAAAICLPECVPAQTNTDAEAQRHFQLAHQARAAGLLRTAPAEYQKVIGLKQKNFAKAEVELKQAVQNDPGGAAHYQLGVVYRTLGRTPDAAREFALSRKINQANLAQAEAKFGPTGAPAQ